MIIDITTRQPIVSGREVAERPIPGPEARDPLRVSETKEGFEACRHRSFQTDQKHRTVKCGDCGIWLDPVWCIGELFEYYEKRIDRRLEDIREFEKKQAQK